MTSSVAAARAFTWTVTVAVAAFLAAAEGGFALPVDVLPADRPLRLSIPGRTTQGWLRVEGDFHEATAGSMVFTLESSSDLIRWDPLAVLLHAPFEFADARPLLGSARFYRLARAERSPTNDWAHQLQFPDDDFFNPGACGSDLLRWGKFAIVLAEPFRVCFQDSTKYLLHVEFATNRLDAFRDLTPAEFDAVALRRENQEVVLGTIIAPLSGVTPEFAIQFSGFDPYPREQIVEWFELVRSAVATENARAYYLPTYEQAASAEAQRDYFAARGIEVIAATRWTTGTTACYSPGWAVGRMQFIPASQLDAAYADGRLGPTDILLTDGVPAEVPYVAGLISLMPATPNSHVAILARSYGVPFVAVADPAEQQRLMGLAGRRVALRTGARLSECQFQILDVEEALPAEVIDHVVELKAPVGLDFPRKAPWGGISHGAETLTPADARYFGGKAANFGLLRRVLPEFSPEAIAFSFDLWDAFMDQPVLEGETLREAIAGRLGEFGYPPDLTRLRVRLAEIRSLIRNTARFSVAQQQEILALLARFDRRRNIRFRSSTNVEDAESFSGAGLYDSYSGCLEDDLDGDADGPSACDATEDDERGVFRAIQRVYASFYNENAVLERLRFRIAEAEVGMALLVHHSTPDEFEWANGVATLTLGQGSGVPLVSGQLVTQAGAVSIANPDGSARAEVTRFLWTPTLTNLEPRESSSLVPFGTRVLAEDDYPMLVGLLGRAAREYGRLWTNRDRIELDFEFKKEAPGRLSIKQIREVPSTLGTNPVPTFLVAAPGADHFPWGGAMAVHRLKSAWKLATRSLVLGGEALGSNFFSEAQVALWDEAGERILSGNPGSWPGASHHVFATNNTWWVEQGFALGAGTDRRSFTLTTRLSQSVPTENCPWLALADLLLEWNVRYPAPVPSLDASGRPIEITSESVSLLRSANGGHRREGGLVATNLSVQLSSSQSMVQLVGQFSDGLPADPRCIVIGPKSSYGFLGVGGETIVNGLLPEPFKVTGSYAQTFSIRGRLGHEQVEDLICEPGLDPNLTPAQRAALAAANVRLVCFHRYQFGTVIESMLILGWDGVFRAVP